MTYPKRPRKVPARLQLSLGHTFHDDLVCTGCGKAWEDQQHTASVCAENYRKERRRLTELRSCITAIQSMLRDECPALDERRGKRFVQTCDCLACRVMAETVKVLPTGEEA